ncbi:MAG: MFS transporter [Coriobacteriia bacterium]|nr:MFS transporter [Coriobacteriia bacterium]
MQETKQSHFRHYLVVAAGISVAFVTALVFNCAGIFFPPVLKSLKIGLTSFALYLTILFLVLAAVLPFWGKLMAKTDVRVLGTVATLVVGAGFFIMSIAKSVYYFYAAGVVLGLVMPFFVYLFIPTMINRWFKERVGFFMGLCLAFTGIAAVIFNPIGAWLITNYGWQTSYRVFGIVCVVLCLPFMLFAVRTSPSDLGLLRYGDMGEASGAGTARPAATGVSASTAMKSWAFYLMALFAVGLGLMTGIYQLLPAYIAKLPLAAAAVTLGAALSSAAMLGQALGKIGLGIVNDKSIPLALILASVCGALGLLGMWLILTSVAIILVSGFLFGIFFACALVQVPLMARSIFGTREFSQIYSRISTVQTFIGAFGVTIWSMIMTSLGSAGLFVGGIALAVLILLAGLASLRTGTSLKHTAATEAEAAG